MKTDYIKYRQFIRQFKEFLEEAEGDTLYEVVGQGGVTIGFFSIDNPLSNGRE